MEDAKRLAGQRDWNEKVMILQECIRFRPLLRQIAASFLDLPGEVENAVNRTIVAATKGPRVFASQGELRSWILRAVIDESQRRLREKQKDERETYGPPTPIPAEIRFATWLVGVSD